MASARKQDDDVMDGMDARASNRADDTVGETTALLPSASSLTDKDSVRSNSGVGTRMASGRSSGDSGDDEGAGVESASWSCCGESLAFLGELCFYAMAIPLVVYLVNELLLGNVYRIYDCVTLDPKQVAAEEQISLAFYATQCIPWGPVGSIIFHPFILATYALFATLTRKRRLLPTLNAFWRTCSGEFAQTLSDAAAALRFPLQCSSMSRQQRILKFTQGMQLFGGYMVVYGYLSNAFDDLAGPGIVTDHLKIIHMLSLRNILHFIIIEQVCCVALNLCFHRYFAHQSFETSRPMRLVLAIFGCASYQRGPLWWASTHRMHHVHCDSPDDPHSRRQAGFIYSHIGWFVHRKKLAVNMDKVPQYHDSYELVRMGKTMAYRRYFSHHVQSEIACV